MIKHPEGKTCTQCRTTQTMFASEGTCIKCDFGTDVAKGVQARKDAVPKKPAVPVGEGVKKFNKKIKERRDGRPTKRDVTAQQILIAEKLAADAFDPQEEAKAELMRRELCRRRLLPFVERFNDQYEAGWVHKDICARLEQFSKDVADRKSPRLMLFMPPRHGKSELASKTFPGWH